MPDQPLRVIVLCGLPFSGKSTLALALAERLDLVIIEVDQVIREGEWYVAGRPIPREAWITAYRISYRRMEAALASGQSVILDATNYRRLHRDLIRSKAARYGAITSVVVMDTPDAEIQARRERNRVSPTRPGVDDDSLRLVRDDMQPPAPDEHPIRFTSDSSIDTLIADITKTWHVRPN